MPPAKLYNLARVTSATVGTGTITLGTAVSGFLTFAQAGVVANDVVSYGIADGANSEVGTGLYNGTTLTRNVTKSTNADAKIAMSGTAQVFICIRAEDIVAPLEVPSGTATETNVAASVTSVVLHAANTARLGMTLYNDSAADCYVNFGAAASATAFVITLAPGSYYEVPYNYTGQLQGMWTEAVGACRVTEFTA